MACLSVCWRFISRWDLERHGIYMMSQLTTLLYFEAFDGDSPKKKKIEAILNLWKLTLRRYLEVIPKRFLHGQHQTGTPEETIPEKAKASSQLLYG